MAKHTQTIRRQFTKELFECVWSFSGTGVRQIALEVRNCLITKHGVLPLTTLLFRKSNFSIRTSYK